LTNKQPIHDLYIRELTVEETDGLAKFHVLSDEDHLLRRFGQVQVIRKSPGRSETLCLREVADEVWALIQGQVEFAWHDLRLAPPSRRDTDACPGTIRRGFRLPRSGRSCCSHSPEHTRRGGTLWGSRDSLGI